jgi:hypothetical protein
MSGASTDGRAGGRRLRWRVVAGGLAVAVAAAILASACSLGNIHHDACKSDAQCETAFGAGSKCSDGYCTPVHDQGCQQKGPDGRACYACPPQTVLDFENACTSAQCAPFDNKNRLTKLNPDGTLPSLP